MRLSPLVDRIGGERAAAWEIHTRAAKMGQAGRDVILLTVGDSDLPTPKPVVDEAVASLRAGNTKYSGSMGIGRFRRAIAADQEKRWGLPVDPGRIAVTTGAQGALAAVALCTLQPGDEVLVLEPMYLTYEAVLGLAGATMRFVPMPPENGFLFDPDGLEEWVTPKTRAILYASPGNPTGSVLRQPHVDAIGALAKKHDLWIFADEVYHSLVYEGEFHSPAADPTLIDRTVVCSSLSKSHAMAGWRMGWAIMPEALAPHVENVQLCTSYGLSHFLQDGAALALEEELEDSRVIKETYARRRDRLVQRLNAMPGLACSPPPGGMFLMLDVRGTGRSTEDYANQLLDAEGVSLLPADGFGPSAVGYVRMCIGAPDERLDEAVDRIERFTQGIMSGEGAGGS